MQAWYTGGGLTCTGTYTVTSGTVPLSDSFDLKTSNAALVGPAAALVAAGMAAL